VVYNLVERPVVAADFPHEDGRRICENEYDAGLALRQLQPAGLDRDADDLDDRDRERHLDRVMGIAPDEPDPVHG